MISLSVFCQYYDCFDAQEEWYSVNQPNEVFSIDYLIGEEEFLRKGSGEKIVALLIDKIYIPHSKATLVVQSENNNIASCKALMANGFEYDKEKEYYKLKTE